MSAVTSRPRVRSVSSAPLSASALLTGGAIVLTGRALFALVRSIDRSLAASLADTQKLVPPVETSDLQSVSRSRREQLATERRVLAASLGAAQPLEALKVAALAGLDAAAFAVAPQVVEEPIRALATAAKPADVEHARVELRRVVEASHLKVLSASIAAACREASEAVGFRDVELRPSSVAQDIRVVATDGAGRALVSEVSVTGNHVGVQTEVIGVTDGSCGQILDAFDSALEARGVHADRTRSYTGGICRLAAARQISGQLSRAADGARRADLRRQRLNTRNRETTRG